MKRIFADLPIILVVLVLTSALFYIDKRQQKAEAKAKMLETTLLEQQKLTEQERISLCDSIELWQAKTKDIYYTKKALEQKYEALLKASKAKAKNVESVTEVAVVTAFRDTIKAQADTFGGASVRYRDEFARIDVDISPGLDAVVDYEIRDSLTVIRYQERKSYLFGLIKKTKDKETRVISHNPKAKVVSVTAVNVIE